MGEAELRRYCAEVVRQLDVPDPFDINVLVDRLERQRQKPISLLPVPLNATGGPSGLWVATGEVDYVLYHQSTTARHQRHIVLHEIGHMLCGHESTPANQDEVARLLMPSLDPELVRLVLGRTEYDRDEERAAELIASLIPLQASSAAPQPSADRKPSEVTALVSHLERSLARGAPRRA
ncbi:protein of unknown function [Streptomyces sp. yr375]|uniref:hypothetical protein n=1 Tax=Streptomyces sp. yr375 TaxID=1761906 RepID=UPI0008C405B6|nr:hypothetical protein [Streptomyces sp. yr375]SES47368.1 protein of unknown function [Streptomyces sp. yr375]